MLCAHAGRLSALVSCLHPSAIVLLELQGGGGVKYWDYDANRFSHSSVIKRQ